MTASQKPPSKDVSDQIAYCGLWCGSCSYGNGVIGEAAGRLEGLVTGSGIEEWGPVDVDYGTLRKSLASIHAAPRCPGCQSGGGRTECEIRVCALGRCIRECADCEAFDACPNRRLRNHMRSGALRAGMIVKDKKGSRSAFLRRAKAEFKKSDKRR